MNKEQMELFSELPNQSNQINDFLNETMDFINNSLPIIQDTHQFILDNINLEN